MTPFFSVILTVYNKQNYVEQTLDSVLNQTFGDFEIIIIDDGSSDNSLSKIENFNDERLRVFTKENGGVSSARNYGIKKANGQYLAFLDGDDLWEREFLDTIKRNISKHREQKVFTTAIAHLYDQKRVPVKYSFDLNEEVSVLNFFENSLRHPILHSSSLVLDSTIISEIGLFDETIKTGEDIDYWIRLGSNFKIVFAHKVLVFYRYLNNSLSNTNYDISTKPTFLQYANLERTDPEAKRYIDKNRYALSIMSKLYGNTTAFKFYSKNIDLPSLNFKKRILINCPSWVLRLFLNIKSMGGKKLYYRPLKSRNS